MADLKLYSTAVIIGCTPAGLTAAQTLTDFFERVTLLQLDACVDDAGIIEDLATHPQVRIIAAREPVVFLLHSSGTFAIGVRYCVADEPAPATERAATERAIIADLIIDGRLTPSDETQIEGVLALHDAPAQRIATALRNSLTPQRTAPHAHTLTGLAARYEHHVRRLAPQ